MPFDKCEASPRQPRGRKKITVFTVSIVSCTGQMIRIRRGFPKAIHGTWSMNAAEWIDSSNSHKKNGMGTYAFQLHQLNHHAYHCNQNHEKYLHNGPPHHQLNHLLFEKHPGPSTHFPGVPNIGIAIGEDIDQIWKDQDVHGEPHPAGSWATGTPPKLFKVTKITGKQSGNVCFWLTSGTNLGHKLHGRNYGVKKKHVTSSCCSIQGGWM